MANNLAEEPVAWVRRVNRAWIVHHGLNDTAESYLNHLAQVDAARLMQSCQNTQQLMQERPRSEDPKPWFYAGLFSLATADEVRQFLSQHWMIATIVNQAHASPPPVAISATTRDKIESIQRAIRQLNHPTHGS